MLIVLAVSVAVKGLVRSLLVKHVGHEGKQTAFVPDKPSLAVFWLLAWTHLSTRFMGAHAPPPLVGCRRHRGRGCEYSRLDLDSALF